jgi:hypothetical protein
MIRRYAAGFRTALMLLDAAIAGGLFVGLTMLRYGTDWAPPWRELVAEPVALPFIVGAFWVSILTYFGLYRPRAWWSVRREAADIVRATAVLAFVGFAVLFTARLVDVSRLFLLGFFPSLAALTLVDRLILRLLFRRYRFAGHNRRYVLVVGAGPRGQAFAKKLVAHRELGLKVIGFLDDRVSWTPLPWPVLGRLDQIEAILHDRVIDEVAICLPYNQWNKVDAITQLCEDEGKIVRVPIELISRAFSAGRMEELDGTPVFSLVSGPDRAISLALKRALDIVASTIALVVLSPLLLAIAFGVRRGGGPALFRQVRVGLHGRRFTVVKFRTMTPDAEARYAEVAGQSDTHGAAFKMTNDPRITPFGRILRRTSLDELPQF